MGRDIHHPRRQRPVCTGLARPRAWSRQARQTDRCGGAGRRAPSVGDRGGKGGWATNVKGTGCGWPGRHSGNAAVHTCARSRCAVGVAAAVAVGGGRRGSVAAAATVSPPLSPCACTNKASAPHPMEPAGALPPRRRRARVEWGGGGGSGGKHGQGVPWAEARVGGGGDEGARAPATDTGLPWSMRAAMRGWCKRPPRPPPPPSALTCAPRTGGRGGPRLWGRGRGGSLGRPCRAGVCRGGGAPPRQEGTTLPPLEPPPHPEAGGGGVGGAAAAGFPPDHARTGQPPPQHRHTGAPAGRRSALANQAGGGGGSSWRARARPASRSARFSRQPKKSGTLAAAGLSRVWGGRRGGRRRGGEQRGDGMTPVLVWWPWCGLVGGDGISLRIWPAQTAKRRPLLGVVSPASLPFLGLDFWQQTVSSPAGRQVVVDPTWRLRCEQPRGTRVLYIPPKPYFVSFRGPLFKSMR